MTEMKIILEVLDHEGLHRYNDHWNIFEDISEPYQIEDEKTGELSWFSDTQNEGVAELLEKAGLVKIDGMHLSVNLTLLSDHWNSYQVHQFKTSQQACRFLRQIVNDDIAEQVSRRLIRQYGRTSPEFYGWDSKINHKRYTGTVK